MSLLWSAVALADPLIDTSVRLLNPPAFRFTCLPSAEFTIIEPVEIGQIPESLDKQKAFLEAAQKQHIYIGFEKVGPFEEHKGTLKASCETGGSQIQAEFSYYNYPTTLDAKGTSISAQGFVNGLNSLSLRTLTINGKSLGNWSKNWPPFMNQCSHPQCPAKLVKVIISLKHQTATACFTDGRCLPFQ